ncbi:MAG: hypothetical protein PHI98_07890 [Eubacteriales bacterium]|nr:hypothetical protein [Eubacteriales bacterium]
MLTIRRAFCALLCFLMLGGVSALGEVVITISDQGGSSSIEQNGGLLSGEAATTDAAPVEGNAAAREAFINDILALAEKEYDAAGGKAQRAQYSGDIYVCKNFTVYLFRQNAEKYRLAEYPDVELKIPDNLPKDECKDYVYGVEWKDVSAAEGNPFVVAAQFRYDSNLSKEENQEAARAFLKQVQRGDYFQMAANYYYGVGAHSMIYTADYDPETDMVHWTDSNMKGEKRNGERYGYVQFDAEKKIDWFVDAFCRKKYGATLYRLRDDIIYAP